MTDKFRENIFARPGPAVEGGFLCGGCAVRINPDGSNAAGVDDFFNTGLLGGFTTFSAFSLETMTLIERGATAQAALYVGLSVFLSVGALALGLMMARGIFA